VRGSAWSSSHNGALVEPDGCAPPALPMRQMSHQTHQCPRLATAVWTLLRWLLRARPRCWPALTQRKLRPPGRQADGGVIGPPPRTTGDHQPALRHRLATPPAICDMLVFLILLLTATFPAHHYEQETPCQRAWGRHRYSAKLPRRSNGWRRLMGQPRRAANARRQVRSPLRVNSRSAWTNPRSALTDPTRTAYTGAAGVTRPPSKRPLAAPARAARVRVGPHGEAWRNQSANHGAYNLASTRP
jgi:hypothetical protein